MNTKQRVSNKTLRIVLASSKRCRFCETVELKILFSSRLYSVTTHCTTLCVLTSIFIVCCTLQTPPSSSKLLIIAWKSLGWWQLRKYSMYHEIVRSNCHTGGCTYNIGRWTKNGQWSKKKPSIRPKRDRQPRVKGERKHFASRNVDSFTSQDLPTGSL